MSENAVKPMSEKLKRMAAIIVMIAIMAAVFWNSDAISWHEFVWLGLFFGMSLIRAPFGMQNRQNKVTVSENHLWEKLLLLGMFLSMGLVPLIYLATKQTNADVFGFADYTLPDFASWIGAALILPFLYLFWRSHSDLGRNWSAKLEIHSEQTLVTNGIYKFVRHPMYLALWLAVIAQALLIHNWIAGFLVVVIFFAMYLSRIQQEETMMRTQFGPDYDAYAQQTGRIFPKLF
ncbi:MAG: protein-S-isoprenylcysteine O-methyltransferase [Pseudomonadota bacterium]